MGIRIGRFSDLCYRARVPGSLPPFVFGGLFTTLVVSSGLSIETAPHTQASYGLGIPFGILPTYHASLSGPVRSSSGVVLISLTNLYLQVPWVASHRLLPPAFLGLVTTPPTVL